MVGEDAEKKLYNAATKGDVATLQQLIQQDPYLVHGVPFPCSRNLLHGQTAIVEEVLKLNPRQARISDSQSSSPLHIAAEEGHVDICQKLLSVAPEACWWRDRHDMNPLHIAAMKGHVEIVQHLLRESPLPAMERLRRGETGELVYATDENGDTILHLAVRSNQLETIRYLVESNKIKRRTRNSMRKTEQEILGESPSEMRRILLRLSLPSFDNFLPKLSDTTMVVVVLIATMAFQNAVNPPGGMWQEDTPSHKPAGDAVIAYTHRHIYNTDTSANTIAFVSSITIFLITTGRPSEDVPYFLIAVYSMWVSLLAIAVSYGASTMVITPNTKTKSIDLIVAIVILVSVVTALFILFFPDLRIFYLDCKKRIRRREDSLPKRILYRITQLLRIWGCFRT
ncbi:ankyrin repeat-containing protein-like protein [Salvia divinorum]|uniref:Ankyrin repeat-containing protein-like protein n=1 Tax=Salvia divinorum TaxID=28513 RepID=A0ABD1I429_SALDI